MTAVRMSPIKAAYQMRLLGIRFRFSMASLRRPKSSLGNDRIGCGRRLAPDEDWLSWSGLNADNSCRNAGVRPFRNYAVV
jgi:hypothetical protein